MSSTRPGDYRHPDESGEFQALMVGLCLVATGGLVSLCGLGISGTALVNAVLRWVKAQQEPPSAIVKRKVAQASAAAVAGASAWHDQPAPRIRAR
jgi:hypothetical protein